MSKTIQKWYVKQVRNIHNMILDSILLTVCYNKKIKTGVLIVCHHLPFGSDLLLDVPEGQCAVSKESVAFSHQKSSIFAPRLSTVFLQQSLSGLPALGQAPVEPGL